MVRHLPMQSPQPDVENFIAALLGRHTSTKPLLVEYLVDDVVRQPIVTGMLGRPWVESGADRESQRAYLDNFIAFWYHMGYDFVRFERSLVLPERHLLAQDPAPGSSKQRAWVDQHHGTITNWADFERYPWPTVPDTDFFAYEYLATHLPEGMGLIVSHGGGVFEHLSHLMSYEGLCFALHDQPDLVQAVVDRLGQLMLDYYRQLVQLDNVVAVFPGDDMGFRTGTLVAPDHLRQYVLPWHKRFADLAHAQGLPYFLHSCGNLKAIMEDLIAGVGIDGKHSFEDAIIPVQDFQARYGNRIAVLGGMDVDILTTASPAEVRRKARSLIDTCGARGRYALGSGNSIPSYIPVDNYLAMLDEVIEAGLVSSGR